MTLLSRLGAALLGFCLALPLAAAADGRSIIVLDASGSMWGQIEGRTKLDIAREALTGVLAEIPADSEVGLMAYGHRSKGDCADIELIVPPGPGTGSAIAQAAADMQFLGKTPLTDAVRQAAMSLRSTEEKATVILITDGVETCEADPCALGTELEASGVDFTAHVVGFGLTAEEGTQVACLAQNTGGQFLTAGDLASLTFALQTTVVSPPAPAPVADLPVEPTDPTPPEMIENNLAPLMALEDAAAPLGDLGQGWQISTALPDGTKADYVTTSYGLQQLKLDPGTYILTGSLGEVQADIAVTLTDDALAQPVLVMNAAPVTLRARGSEGGPVEQNASFLFTLPNGDDPTLYPSASDNTVSTYLPAGSVGVKVTIGQTSVSETLTVVAGQPLDHDVIVGSGVAVINGFYVEGMMVEGGAQFVEVQSATMSIAGDRESFGSTYGQDATFTLPPGDYVAQFRLGGVLKQQPFTVALGQRVEVPVLLNAGVLAVTAPGATTIEVLAAKPDLNGNRETITFEYTETVTITLPAGDYAAVAKFGETLVEGAAQVSPGARTDLPVAAP